MDPTTHVRVYPAQGFRSAILRIAESPVGSTPVPQSDLIHVCMCTDVKRKETPPRSLSLKGRRYPQMRVFTPQIARVVFGFLRVGNIGYPFRYSALVAHGFRPDHPQPPSSRSLNVSPEAGRWRGG